MTTILAMRCGHAFRNARIDFAEKCSWRAGPILASEMRNNDFESNERVFVAIEDDRIAGFCTFSNKDEMPDKYDFTPFIGFVFVDEKHRGHRLSEKMIHAACEYARQLDHSRIYIMSGEVGLYEKYGFVKIGEYETVYGTVDQLFYMDL